MKNDEIDNGPNFRQKQNILETLRNNFRLSTSSNKVMLQKLIAEERMVKNTLCCLVLGTVILAICKFDYVKTLFSTYLWPFMCAIIILSFATWDRIKRSVARVFFGWRNSEIAKTVTVQNKGKVMRMTRISELRLSFLHKETLRQDELDPIIDEIRSQKDDLRPDDKDEILPLFNSTGKATGAQAPRWICHVLGLRHRCAHVLLTCRGAAMGDVLILQVRSWSKDDSPSKLDITVGGHMTALDEDAQKVALNEMLQEVGLTVDDLENNNLAQANGYAFDETPRPTENFYNHEWRDVFVGFVKYESFGKIHFSDGEVAGIALFPIEEAEKLLHQRRAIGSETLQMASALRHSLPLCLKKLSNGEQTVMDNTDKP